MGFLIGAGLFAAMYPKLEGSILHNGDFGQLTLPQLLKVNHWAAVIPSAIVLAALLVWMEKAGL